MQADLFGLRLDNTYIDNVSKLMVNGKDLGSLYDSGYFDNVDGTLTDVENASLKNFKIYLLGNSTVIKGNIDRIDVVYVQGNGGFYVKIYSTFENELPQSSAGKYLCVLSEQDVEVEKIIDGSHDEAVESILNRFYRGQNGGQYEFSVFDKFTVEDKAYYVIRSSWTGVELYIIYDENSNYPFDLGFSKP